MSTFIFLSISNIYKISKLRCPNCHHFLKQFGEKDKEYFGCDCGFKEKCDKFFANLKDNNQGMNKKELRKVLENELKELKRLLLTNLQKFLKKMVKTEELK